MVEILNIGIFNHFFIGSIIFFFATILIFLKLVPDYLATFFGECISNHKSSKFHSPMLRGLGIVFPIILITSSFLWGSIFNNFEIIIITLSTIVGFFDDKFGLNQKKKLLIFILIGFLWAAYKSNLLINDIGSIFNFLTSVFIFVFLVLFFNQIDGINGLATVTFMISVIILHFMGTNLILLLPIFLSIVVYLFINLAGKIGIQGDSGSFFMGSFIAILSTKTVEFTKIGIIFFIFGPVIFDVCATTLVRIYYKIDLTLGHRNNLYQKLVSKYQNHTKVTFLFGLSQIILSSLYLILFDVESLLMFYIVLFTSGSCFILLFVIIAYFIYTEKILK